MKELEQYAEFVKAVTSEPSLDANKLVARILELNEGDINIAQLLTGAIGMADESGEFLGLVKKLLFQGKPLNEELRQHMIKELGDIQFYAAEAIMSINADPYEIINENVKKLEARYPGGKFSITSSEVRKEGDI
jgi:hypothetical protein